MHRGARLAAVESPPVHLGQMPDQLGLDSPTPPDQFCESSEQCIVGQALETGRGRFHASVITRRYFGLASCSRSCELPPRRRNSIASDSRRSRSSRARRENDRVRMPSHHSTASLEPSSRIVSKSTHTFVDRRAIAAPIANLESEALPGGAASTRIAFAAIRSPSRKDDKRRRLPAVRPPFAPPWAPAVGICERGVQASCRARHRPSTWARTQARAINRRERRPSTRPRSCRALVVGVVKPRPRTLRCWGTLWVTRDCKTHATCALSISGGPAPSHAAPPSTEPAAPPSTEPRGPRHQPRLQS
jgi:hypothetical protein